MEFLAGQELNQPDLTGVLHVGAAAGAQVYAGELHQPHRAVDGLFAPIGEGGQRLRVGVKGPHRQIVPDHPVGFGLDGLELVLGEETVKVDGDGVVPHVEAHIVEAKLPEDQTGDDMLAAVLLHQAVAAAVIEAAGDRLPNGQRVLARSGRSRR